MPFINVNAISAANILPYITNCAEAAQLVRQDGKEKARRWMTMSEGDASQYQGGWNMNKDFLGYVCYLLQRSGLFAEVEDAKRWLLVDEELYRKTGGIVKSPEYKDKLNEIRRGIYSIAPISNEAQRLNAAIALRNALSDLDLWEIEYIGLLHKHNLILPKSTQKRGLKSLEDDFDIHNEEPQ